MIHKQAFCHNSHVLLGLKKELFSILIKCLNQLKCQLEQFSCFQSCFGCQRFEISMLNFILSSVSCHGLYCRKSPLFLSCNWRASKECVDLLVVSYYSILGNTCTSFLILVFPYVFVIRRETFLIFCMLSRGMYRVLEEQGFLACLIINNTPNHITKV